MEKEEIEHLVEKYLQNTITEKERQRLLQWYHVRNQEDVEWMDEDENTLESRIYGEIRTKIFPVGRTSRISSIWKRVGIAASVLLVVSTGLYFYNSDPQVTETRIAENVKTPNDIQPGGNNAILILADGSMIKLNDADNGILTNQDGIKIEKVADGKLVYLLPANKTRSEVTYHTMMTPIGGQYTLDLPDGSRVWLNSSSSIRFPVFFSGDYRDVEIKGEAYFEIASDRTKPFRVKTRNQRIEVIGTHFNVNAYDDEPSVSTTLLEGSVKVLELASGKSIQLKPGEQANLSEGFNVKQVDLQAVVAWKEGYFQFNDVDIETVMRQLGRWYGISVRHDGTIPDKKYAGAISRKLTLLQVLEILERNQIHFKLEGKEVVIMP